MLPSDYCGLLQLMTVTSMPAFHYIIFDPWIDLEETCTYLTTHYFNILTKHKQNVRFTITFHRPCSKHRFWRLTNYIMCYTVLLRAYSYPLVPHAMCRVFCSLRFAVLAGLLRTRFCMHFLRKFKLHTL